MTQLQVSICMLFDTFDKYAKEDGKNNSLSKAEAKKLMEKELPEMIKGAKNQQEVDNLIKGLDADGDGEIDFQEFMIMVACLACAFRGAAPGKKAK